MIEIPNGVTVSLDGHKATIKGHLGEVQKIFSKEVKISLKDNSLVITTSNKALENTSESMLQNMIIGVTEGYKKNLKLIYAHFPITIEVKGKDVLIKNFLGEKKARKTVLIGHTKIDAKGQTVTISGPDKDAVGQTLANIRQAMHIRDKDGRVFQDGIYEVATE